MDLFGFSTCSFFFHFISFGLRPSGSGFDGSFWFFDLQLLFPFYCLWFKAVGFRLSCIFFVFRLAASFSVLLPWFKAVGFGLSCIFFCFSTSSFFIRFIAFGLRPSGLGFDGFFVFFDLQLLFPFYCLWFKAVGFRL